jgi:integrase/recombinase XerC
MTTETTALAVIETEATTLAHPGSLEHNPAAVYLAGLAQGSRRTMTEALDTIAGLVMSVPKEQRAGLWRSFPWAGLRYQHTQAIRTALGETYSASTANKMLSALRGTLKEAWRLGLVSAEDYHRAVDVKTIKGHKAAQAEKGRHLTQGELTKMLNTCTDGSKAGARDAAIIAIGYLCGLRRAELVNLDLSDYDPENNTLTVRAGKGNKERIVPVGNGALDALQDWLHLRGPWAGPLFYRIRRGDVVTGERLNTQAIYTILQSRADRAGVKNFSPHDLRRTFAGDLLDAGADIVTVQKLMGHANVTTTAGYDRRDAKAKRSAVNKLHVSYRRQFGE